MVAGDLVPLDGGTAVLGETGEAVWERADTAAIDLVFRGTRAGEMVWRSPFQRSEPEPFVGVFRPIESMVSGTTLHGRAGRR